MDPYQKQQQIFVSQQNARVTKQLFKLQEISQQIRELISRQSNQLYRIFHGPSPSLKILAILKVYQMQLGPGFIFILKICLINMDSEGLDPIRLMWKETQTQIYDVAVHPNGEQMVIVYKGLVQKYRLVLNKQNTNNYQFQLQKSVKTEELSVSDLKYHPSGKFLLAIVRVKGQNNMVYGRTFRLESQSLSYKTGTGDLNQCFSKHNKTEQMIVQKNQRQCSNYRNFYLVKNLIAIDKKNESIAMIGGGGHILCLWNVETGELFGNRRLTLYSDNNVIENSVDAPYQSLMPSLSDSVFSMNYEQSSYLISLDSRNLIGYLYKSSDPNFQLVFSYSLAQRDECTRCECKRRSTYCVDIPQISSIACTTENLNITSIIKLKIKSQPYQSKAYQILPQLPSVIAGQRKTKQIFYYQPKSELCLIIDDTIQCNTIQAQCGQSNQSKPIHQCRNQCDKKSQSKVWNPIGISCEPCVSKCSCQKHYQFFDYFLNKCVLNCSEIKETVKYQENKKEQRCLCREPYQWFDEIQACRINCASIPYSEPNANLDRQNIDVCKCKNNFFFSKKLGSDKETIGQCILKCAKGSSIVEGGKIFCECQEQEYWDQRQFMCKNKFLSLMPGWSIALIVIIVLAVVGLIIYAIVRWKRKYNKSAEDRQQDDEPDGKGYAKDLDKEQEKGKGIQVKETPLSQRNIINQKVQDENNEDFVIEQQKCVICNKQSPPPDHTGSCFHGFHKECYDKRKSKCPLCEAAEKQQMISIQNDFN